MLRTHIQHELCCCQRLWGAVVDDINPEVLTHTITLQQGGTCPVSRKRPVELVCPYHTQLEGAQVRQQAWQRPWTCQVWFGTI